MNQLNSKCERDLNKAMFKKFNSEVHWEKFKTIRNEINVEIEKLKADYYSTKISECLLHNNF